MRTLITLAAAVLLLAGPANAQLNHQKIQQNAEQKIHEAGDQQQQTQTTINNTNAPPAQAQAAGTVLAVDGEVVTLNQQITINGQAMTVKNKFYLQKSTIVTAGMKLAPKSKVHLTFVNGADGRRMITSIAP